MDVFLRWWPQNSLREHLAWAVCDRLKRMPGINLHELHGPKFTDSMDFIEILGRDFHITSKRVAEKMTGSEIYCVIDDDQLPIRDDFFSLGEKALTEHPEYGLLAGFPLEYAMHGQPYADRTEEVIEAHSIGCPYFCKKGILSFPDGPLRQYDAILSKVVTDQGLKTGFARKCLYNHLGFGFTQIGQND